MSTPDPAENAPGTALGTDPDPRSDDPDQTPPLRVAVPLAIQHVLAMFASNVTIPIILAGVIGASTGQTTALVQIAILVSGLATLVQTVGIGPVGARLPIVQGTGFAFAALAFPLAAEYGVSAVFGGALVAAVVQSVLGLVLRWVRWLFPPVVIGVVITSVGMGLLPVGMELAAGGVGSEDFGDPVNLGLAALVLVLTCVLSQFGTGMWSAAAVLVALVLGYLAAIPFGLVDFAQVEEASWLSVAVPFEFGVSFPVAAVVAMSVVAVVNALDSIGTISAITKGGADREPTGRELSGAVMADGAGSLLAGVFGTIPNTSFSQNAGLVAITRVMSRHVVTIGGVLLVFLSLLPKASALVAAMPSAVLGGAALVLFGMVMAIGFRMLGETGLDQRLLLIVAVSLGVGQGLALVPETVAGAPEQVRVLLETGVVPAAAVAVALNLVFPDGPRSSAPSGHPVRSREAQ